VDRNSKDSVRSYFEEALDRWTQSYFEYAEDVSELGAMVRQCFHPGIKPQARKEQLRLAWNKANCFFVLLHILQLSIPQYRAAIPVIHELCKALYRCAETGKTSSDLDTAGAMLESMASAAWFATVWSEAVPIPTTSHKIAGNREKTTATSQDIQEAYHKCKALGLKPNKVNVRRILKDDGKTRANDALNTELRRMERRDDKISPQ